MREDLVSLAQAAHILGIGERQLQRMVKNGILKPHPTKSKSTIKNRLFRATDIAALQEIRARGSNPEAAFVEARQAAMETRAMRHELEQMRFVFGLNLPLIGTDRDTVIALLLKAEDALRGLATTDPEELLEWAQVLHSLTEAHFESITFHSSQKEPWRAFLNLGRKLLAAQDPLALRNNLDLYNIYRLLAAALRRLRITTYLHIRTLYGREYATKVLPDVEGDPHEDVISLSFNNLLWETPQLPS